MKLQNLQYFEKLIELKNYSSVAEFFNVGQPTVSMSIKRLEQDVGYNLIVHNSKYNELILTSAGKNFHKYSKEIISQLTLLNQEIERQLQQPKVNLGMPPMINNTYFSKLATKLNKNTLANITIIEDHSTNLIKMLKHGDIDMSMIASTEPVKINGIHSEVLTKDKFKVVLSKKNPLANKSKITFADVDSSKVIKMTDGYIQAKIFNRISKERLSNPEIVYRTSDYKMIKQLIKENVGISFLLEKSISPEDDLVMIDPDSNRIPQIYISLIWRKGYHLNDLQQNLIDTIRKFVKNIS